MLVRLWNPIKKEWEFIKLEVPGKPKIGPSDEYLFVEGCNVEPDKNGNFIRKDYSEEELDAVHAFAIARSTISMWEKALGEKIKWAWGKEQLKIRLYEPLIDAVFRNSEISILFGESGINKWCTCRAIDIVAHETCHAILEALKPEIHKSRLFETKALIEGICDLTGIFLKAKLTESMFDKIILNRPNYFSEFGMGFGYNNSKSNSIRSAFYVSTLPFDQSTLYDGASKFINKIYMDWLKLINKGYSLALAGSILLALIVRSLKAAGSEPTQTTVLNFINKKSSEI